MSQVKSKNTKPELFVFSILDKLGIKYEKHFLVHGKPDVSFPKLKIAIFINGEYWHGRRFHKEKHSYQEFWVNKIRSNMNRDRRNYQLLKAEGWTVLKIWDKDIKKHPLNDINKIMRYIKQPLINKSDLEI